MDEEVKTEGTVPTGDVQLAINQAIVNMLDPQVDRNTFGLAAEKIRTAKELMG